MIPNFFYSDDMTCYDFGPLHPLKPERLRRTARLLTTEGVVKPIKPDPACEEDLARVHSPDYIEAVKRGTGDVRYGLGTVDNPVFERMHERSLWYVGGAVAAAKCVRDGARLAFNISGGLHHAMRDRASGFCVYNDPAVAIEILRERFRRIAYIDIDVHHGDGVEAIYDADPNVLTVSIHESGLTLFPGTGFAEDRGSAKTSLNIPLAARTTGDVWLWAFERIVPAAIRSFEPEAIVLQMGTDAHFLDPLGHLRVAAQEWLEAVRIVRDFGLPIVACGGGGYNLTTVPRMWAAACMTLAGIEVPEELPKELQEEFGTRYYSDQSLPSPRQSGLAAAEEVVRFHLSRESLV